MAFNSHFPAFHNLALPRLSLYSKTQKRSLIYVKEIRHAHTTTKSSSSNSIDASLSVMREDKNFHLLKTCISFAISPSIDDKLGYMFGLDCGAGFFLPRRQSKSPTGMKYKTCAISIRR